MFTLVYTALFLPLIGFLVLVGSSKWISRKLTGYIGCGTVFLSFLCFISLLYTYVQSGNAETYTLYRWIPVERINADFALHLDALSLVMALIITGVGFLIHVYSNGYIEHDEDYARYFAFLNFFIFAMLLLVLAANLLLLFVGWEGVGLASYLLIGYWYERPTAAQAATKAFVVNRIGDCGFLIGLLLSFYLFGTSDIVQMSQQAASVGKPLLILLTALLFVGAIGKSAQMPLHIWLPDAMEGPTPVSALIHAATMVTAGVYLVVRMHAVYMLAPEMLFTVGIIGGVTSLFAAICAIGQTDLKRVLAYSTVSQLGLMFLACGIGAFYAAMFHLTTHAFVKALLFLSAGNVVHMMRGTTDMGKMGGLDKIFTKTHWLFLIGVLGMAGVPPLAAFFSKDLILEQEHLAGFEILFGVGLAVTVLTGFYLTRAYMLTFTGQPNLSNGILKSIKEAPQIMLIPVAILALLSIVGGFLGFCFNCTKPILEGFLSRADVTLPEKELLGWDLFLSPETWLSIFVAVFGVVTAYILYKKYADRLGQPIQVLVKAFYLNEIYWALFAKPLEAISKFIADFLEPDVFDGSLNVITDATQKTAGALQKMQSGQIRSYVAWMAIGTVILLAYFIF